jgi:hypothetical protein
MADVYFQSYQDIQDVVTSHEVVITTDSLPSHIAQFFARFHILLTSRSRPQNICFPGVGRTAIVDLGSSVGCRPCRYLYRSADARCAAGKLVCEAFEGEFEGVLDKIALAIEQQAKVLKCDE